MSASTHTTAAHQYAALFSTRSWRQWIRGGKVDSFFSFPANQHPARLMDYVDYAYDTLKSTYRNEYIYKNTIINQLLIDFSGLSDAVLLNEFRINKSVADLVFINGTSTVFEVKSELDTPARLATQTNDYLQLFREVYVVIHESHKDKYLNATANETGLMILTNQMTLETVRKATPQHALNPVVAIKALRKHEYSNVVKAYFGNVPPASDFAYFGACKELFKQIPADTLHELICRELKKRQPKAKQLLVDSAIPQSLKHICHSLDLGKQEYAQLRALLHTPI